MFLQRATAREEAHGGGGLYLRRNNFTSHFPGTSSESDAGSRHDYPCQRNYPPASSPAVTCGRAAATDINGSAVLSSTRTASRSPPASPVTTGPLPGKSSLGVFLQNCQLSADFLQLRRESRAAHAPVRLYLTSTELVKKTFLSSTATAGTTTTRAHPSATAAGSGRDFTLSRYPLQDVEVSASKVSPGTMVVSTLAPAPRAGEAPGPDAGGVHNSTASVGVDSSTTTTSGPASRNFDGVSDSRSAAAGSRFSP